MVPEGYNLEQTGQETQEALNKIIALNAVEYTQQILTEAQKAQARGNIGAEEGAELKIEHDLPDDFEYESKAYAMEALGVTEQELDDLFTGKCTKLTMLWGMEGSWQTYSRLGINTIDGGIFLQAFYNGSVVLTLSLFSNVPDGLYSFTTNFVSMEYAENTMNKVTSLSASSTDTEYPSAKCVYDLVGKQQRTDVRTNPMTHPIRDPKEGDIESMADAEYVLDLPGTRAIDPYCNLMRFGGGGYTETPGNFTITIKDPVPYPEATICSVETDGLGNYTIKDAGGATIGTFTMEQAVEGIPMPDGLQYLKCYVTGTVDPGLSISAYHLAASGEYLNGAWVTRKPVPDTSAFITKSVNDLVNYYLKSETYTKSEVQALIAAINQFHYEVYASLEAVTSPANNVLYLIGPTGSGSDKYEEYVWPDAQTGFVKIGDTTIDLSGYVTTEALNTALAAYTTTADLTTLLAAKYEKPSGGIPESDLASGVIPDVSVKQHRYEVSDLSSITDPKEGDVAVVTEYEPLGFTPSLSGTESLCARAKQMPTNPGTWSVYSIEGSYGSVILQSFQGDSSAGKINVLDENGVVVGVLPDYDSDDYYEFLRGPYYGIGISDYSGTTYQTGQYVQLYRATRHVKEYLCGKWVDVNDRGLLMTSDSIPSPWSTGKTLAETAAVFGITEAQLLSLCDGAYSTIVTFDGISGGTDLVTVTSTAVGVVVLSFAKLGLAKRYNLTYDVTFDIGSGSSYSNFTLTDTTPVTDISGKEDISNKVTSLSAQSTDTQYPGAKCVYDQLATKQDLIDSTHKLDYSLIDNTPTIPAAQIQSDWNQSDNTAKDFIKNKPTIPTVPVTDVTVGGTSVVSNGTAAVPAIPDAVEANPTVPSGTTPTSLTGLKIGSGYYSISGGGGGGTAITSQEIADIWTNVMS